MPDRVQALDERILELIQGPQYDEPQAVKDTQLTPILRDLCTTMGERCPAYGRFLSSLGGDPYGWQHVADVPTLPVSMFKRFALSAVTPENVVRELHSSTTTSRSPSRIFIDKTTAFRQARALASILKEQVGGRRRPFLVLDAEEAVADGETLTARGAAIRGVGTFANTIVFAMDKKPSGDLEPAFDRIGAFFEQHSEAPLLVFGFTFVVWTRFIARAERKKLQFRAPGAVLLHSGGWKTLSAEAVTPDEFRRRAAAVLGCETSNVVDFYGMVEQVGTVFLDCKAGNKHAPAFADVVIRRPHSLAPVDVGEAGIIEVVSALPTSYPGHALLTEDQGVLLGIDDCPCGRKGAYFRFTKRIERAEIRGCGDTFAQLGEAR